MGKRRGSGEGSITQRKDGKYQESVVIGYDSDKGKPKKKYFHGRTRKEVQNKITEVLGKVQAGTYQEPTKLKVYEWFNIWLEEYQKPSLSPTTFQSYKIQVDKTRHFERTQKNAGIEKINFHALRHTFATLSLQEGVNIRTIQETLGHHKAAFTLDVYSSVTDKMKKEATSKIGNLIASCIND